MSQLLHQQPHLEEEPVELITTNKIMKSCVINCVGLYDVSREVLTGYQLVIRDVSKRKAAERELLQAEKLSMTGKIARTIAHEVRNPLTNLTLALEQLKDEIPEHIEDAELYFNIIKRNAARIDHLISELLNSAKPKDLKLEENDLNEVIEESLILVEDRLKLQNMKLAAKLSSISKIILDKDQLKVAFLNLFINAIEAMKPNRGILTVETMEDSGQIILKIGDNGKGMSKGSLEQLFEPFYTAKKGGMGLGLTTVQNIIHSHGGKIEVKSELKIGTTFHITFKL